MDLQRLKSIRVGVTCGFILNNAPMETDDPRGYTHRTRAGGLARLKNLTYGNVA